MRYSLRQMPHDWPAILVGALALGYWGRVVRMAWKAGRRAGRGANFLPPERLGTVLRLVWVPAVLLWIVHPFLTGFWSDPPAGLRKLFDLPQLNWPAAGLAVATFALTLLCWKRMGKSWRMGIDPAEKTPLVVSGPYRYVRHPIYALSSLLMLCTLVIVPTPLMLAAGAAHLLLLQWEAAREERHLLRQHGELYARYRARTGRFIPVRFGRVDDSYEPDRAA